MTEHRFEVSIIIPVFNKWELTRNCLKSLAATVNKDQVEVIVVDNASTDVTQDACNFLGKRLFGESFIYIRNEQNRNFAGASNQGAECARGEFLIFLNNDTVAESGWYEPLIADFANYADIAGTGPVLVYPEATPFGRTVQHLGILVAPFLKFGHLYQGIPENSALAKKRRFFQVITGACMVIRKTLFLQAGKFDEKYINGFEDVDLCGRLISKGYRFTINPASKVVHYESQTPGRGSNEGDNFSRLQQTNIRHFKPDWQLLIEPDGLTLKVNEWAQLQQQVNDGLHAQLEKKLESATQAELKNLLTDYVYWNAGWRKYLENIKNPGEYLADFNLYYKFFETVPNAAKAVEIGREHSDKLLQRQGRLFLCNYSHDLEELIANAKAALAWCQKMRLFELAAQYQDWLDNLDNFKKEVYSKYERLLKLEG